MKTEFIALSPTGLVATFAAGFFLGDGIDALMHGQDAALHVFGMIIAALMVRTDARAGFASGKYERGIMAQTAPAFLLAAKK